MRRWGAALAALAALSGAAGVAAAAAAAHVVASPDLKIASDFLMLHAAAVIAITAYGLNAPRGGLCLAAASLLLAGNFLFCGDLTSLALRTSSLFYMAAPLGGIILILAWGLAAVALAATAAKKPR